MAANAVRMGAATVLDRAWRPLATAVGTIDAADPHAHVVLEATAGWLPTSCHPVAALAGGLQAAVAAAALQLRRARTTVDAAGTNDDVNDTPVCLDVRHACAEFMSERLLAVGPAGSDTPAAWDALAGNYPACGGKALVRLHTNFTHHREAALAGLGVSHTPGEDDTALRERVSAALAAAPDADDVVERIVAKGGVAARLRTADEWEAHAQGQAVASLPLIERLEESNSAEAAAPLSRLPPLSSASDALPLEGVRVLDLTRVIAGPVAGRTLAALGADVLRISGPADVPHVPLAVLDTNRGKRTACLDLRTSEGRRRLLELACDAHVVLLASRPGCLDGHECGAAALRASNEALVVVELSAYGRLGPWSNRRGFDSIVQVASGIHDDEGGAALPMQALDHGAGTLMAATAVAALAAGRAGHYTTSLAQMAHFLRTLRRDGVGLVEPSTDDGDSAISLAEGFAEFVVPYPALLRTNGSVGVDDEGFNSDTREVEMMGVAPAIRIPTASARDPCQLLTVPLGYHEAGWL